MKVEDLRELVLNNLIDSSGTEREMMALKLISNKLPVEAILDILLLDPPLSMRFSWLLGDISGIDPSYAHKILAFCLKHYGEIKVRDIDRVTAKQALLNNAPLSEKMEGELLNKLFNWLANPKTSISTKRYSFLCLKKILRKYPELMDELKLILLENKECFSNSFKKLVTKELDNDSFFED